MVKHLHNEVINAEFICERSFSQIFIKSDFFVPVLSKNYKNQTTVLRLDFWKKFWKMSIRMLLKYGWAMDSCKKVQARVIF